ncbi:MAG: DUF3291 domain-containing protein [Candidatus Methylomirabilales bacterium]
MPGLPWKTFRKAEPGREYLVLLTELPLKSYLAIPRFLLFTRQVQQQLSNAPGLIGYSLLARPLRKQSWTLSVWESEKALMELVHAMPHHTVMAALRPAMGPTRFIRWMIHGKGYPPTWEDALARTALHPPGGTPPSA